MEITINDISKQIGNKKIYSNVSFNVHSGECVALIGPNGAGKTSIIRSILGIYCPDSGSIMLDNYKPEEKEYKNKLREISAILENLGLYRSLTAYQNIEFFDRLYFPRDNQSDRNDRILEALKMFDLYESKDLKITFFSKGMKQRLALARGIVTKPSFLILDEPFQGLDIDGALLLRDYINDLKMTGVSVLVSSHDLLVLEKICDKFVFIKNGSCIANIRKERMIEVIKEANDDQNESIDLELFYRKIMTKE